MIPKNFFHSLTFQLSVALIATVVATYFALQGKWLLLSLAVAVCLYSCHAVRKLFRRQTEKITSMFDAIDNADYAFRFAAQRRFSHDALVNNSLNRILQILVQAKIDALHREKYYELIINSISTGILVIDDNGYVVQTNSEALRMLGLAVFTYVKQLGRINEKLEALITNILPGDKRQISFDNERETVSLSVRASGMTLRDKRVRIVAINNIRSELEEMEVDSWIRLTRVLTHEIMNSITPIVSLSQTLFSIHVNADKEIRDGLDVICSTSKSLISFVDSYRKFTHIPQPKPSLFYVQKFAERMIQLALHQNNCPDIAFVINVAPDDLILYADENLIAQVTLNILKNAIQAVGNKRPDGRIELKAYCNADESVIIEIANNGPAIAPEVAKHIFVPFFTTKEGGSGVGLSIARQIMRLAGGNITLKNAAPGKQTTFLLTFP